MKQSEASKVTTRDAHGPIRIGWGYNTCRLWTNHSRVTLQLVTLMNQSESGVVTTRDAYKPIRVGWRYNTWRLWTNQSRVTLQHVTLMNQSESREVATRVRVGYEPIRVGRGYNTWRLWTNQSRVTLQHVTLMNQSESGDVTTRDAFEPMRRNIILSMKVTVWNDYDCSSRRHQFYAMCLIQYIPEYHNWIKNYISGVVHQ